MGSGVSYIKLKLERALYSEGTLGMRAEGQAFPAQVQGVIEHRLEAVEARMRELRHVRRVLQRSLEECREPERTGRCRVVDDLSTQAEQPRG